MRIHSLIPYLSYPRPILQREATRRITIKRRFGDNAERFKCRGYLSLFVQLQLAASSKKTSIRNEFPFTYTGEPFIMDVVATEHEKHLHHIYVGNPSKRCKSYGGYAIKNLRICD